MGHNPWHRGPDNSRHRSVHQRPTFQLLNRMTNLKKNDMKYMPLDATPTTYVQCDESNNNMAHK
jgi:hypothetical protein